MLLFNKSLTVNKDVRRKRCLIQLVNASIWTVQVIAGPSVHSVSNCKKKKMHNKVKNHNGAKSVLND